MKISVKEDKPWESTSRLVTPKVHYRAASHPQKGGDSNPAHSVVVSFVFEQVGLPHPSALLKNRI